MTKKNRADTLSIPLIKKNISLNTHNANRAYKKHIDNLSKAMQYMDVVIPLLSKKDFKEKMNKSDTLIVDQFAKCTSYLMLENEKLADEMVSFGCDDSVTYPKSKTIEVEVSSPKIKYFIEIILLLDSLLVKVDQLWLAGAKTNKERSESQSKYELSIDKYIKKVVSYEINLWNEISKKGKLPDMV